MSFFSSLLRKYNLPKHDGRPLWKYSLTDQDYENLVSEINYTSSLTLDPRDACLYYAEWWKRNFNGGKPSRDDVFKSLSGNINYRMKNKDFYKLARKGANMLGVQWISKQYTLYFRTLLLQGGLPLNHISENQGNYQNFLLAVLEEQPETIEDFIFKPHIINYLPTSSRNDIIYENCLEIVRSILNEEDQYDDLFSSNAAIKDISGKLKVRKAQLKRRQRISKPKNYWLLCFIKEKINISLKIGFADKYDSDALAEILGFEVIEKEYQFYLNDELICVFRKMLNGKYKTDWFSQHNHNWDGDSNLPNCYVLVQGKKHEVQNFINTMPNPDEPGLWTKYSDNEWRLIKGNGTPNKEAAILFPYHWNSHLTPEVFRLHGERMKWLRFEGEIQITSEESNLSFLSEVNSLDWSIVSQKPSWMLKTAMPVVQRKPAIVVYDENNRKLPESLYNVYFRIHPSKDIWQDLSSAVEFPLGCVDLKIIKDDLVAYDMCYNIGNLQVDFHSKSIDSAKVEVRQPRKFDFRINETENLSIEWRDDQFNLKVKTESRKIPTGLKASVGIVNRKKLHFVMDSPFKGMAIIDKKGNIISEDQQLSLYNLYGLRILSTPGFYTYITIKNVLNPDVRISKEIREHSTPLLSFRNEIVRLYYLADAMEHRNLVSLELRQGENFASYKISGFTHTLSVAEQLDYRVSLFNSSDELDLYAVPVNCSAGQIELVPLLKDELFYKMPFSEKLKQYIIISSKENGTQLMPRFVNTDPDFVGLEKEERIKNFHNLLLDPNFKSEIWQQILSYYKICVEHDLPFSTFDQLRAISKSSGVAAMAFFFLGINESEPDNFIQKTVPEMELDLGFCFHWIKKQDWEEALHRICELIGHQYFDKVFSLLSSYMQENNLNEVTYFLSGNEVGKVYIGHRDILSLRAELGDRVLNELPGFKPTVTQFYNIPVQDHQQVGLLLHSPIAVAESIKDIQQEKPIWGGDHFRDSIRRSIQYCQYLNPGFYNKTLLHALKNN
jgi:hypothetical protein